MRAANGQESDSDVDLTNAHLNNEAFAEVFLAQNITVTAASLAFDSAPVIQEGLRSDTRLATSRNASPQAAVP